MKINKRFRPILFWIIGMILCPLGVAFSVKSGFGVSMIEAPVYVLHLYISKFWNWFTFGTSEYTMQAILIAAMCIVIRRFRWKYLLSFGTAFLYGQILDAWYALLGHEQYASMIMRVVSGLIGLTVTALAVAFFFRTWMPQEAWELFVKEVSENYNLNMTKFKWGYDISSLLLGVVLMVIFFRGILWNAIGIGTLVTTLLNAPLIGFWGKAIERLLPAKS